MRHFIIGLGLALLAIFAMSAHADERITTYKIDIEATENGDLNINENITVIIEGNQIRRGIFRDLPRYLLRDNNQKIPQRYTDLRVALDGESVPKDTERSGNQMRVKIGDPERYAPRGEHTYTIAYTVPNALRRAQGREEIYWNPVGAYWLFSIDRAEVSLKMPGGVSQDGILFYRGAEGSGQTALPIVRNQGDSTLYIFDRPLARQEGITMSLSVPKGSFSPLTDAQKRQEFMDVHGSAVTMGGTLAALLALFGLAWARIGRDPVKDPIIPLYGPPKTLSPAAASHIYYRSVKGHQPIIATMTNLAIKNYLKINVDKKVTTITTLKNDEGETLPNEERLLYDNAFKGAGKTITLGKKPNPAFAKAASKFNANLSKQFGSPYYKRNGGFVFLFTVLGFAGIAGGVIMARGSLGLLDWGLIAALIVAWFVVNGLIAAPTPEGQKLHSQIAGFRLYMDTAEKSRLNAVDVTGKRPPPMTTQLYERFLPYAIALNVEEPWTKHFEKIMPREAAEHQLHNISGSMGRSGMSNMTKGMVAAMATGVAAAAPASSSSSGSGGGGSVGGGGGGGGGGGW